MATQGWLVGHEVTDPKLAQSVSMEGTGGRGMHISSCVTKVCEMPDRDDSHSRELRRSAGLSSPSPPLQGQSDNGASRDAVVSSCRDNRTVLISISVFAKR
jgi:hypothetical protein